MGLLSGKLQVGKTTEPAPNELNTQELELLLSMLKNATFKGENVEIVYNTILKLQNKYLEQTKK